MQVELLKRWLIDQVDCMLVIVLHEHFVAMSTRDILQLEPYFIPTFLHITSVLKVTKSALFSGLSMTLE